MAHEIEVFAQLQCNTKQTFDLLLHPPELKTELKLLQHMDRTHQLGDHRIAYAKMKRTCVWTSLMTVRIVVTVSFGISAACVCQTTQMDAPTKGDEMATVLGEMGLGPG